MSKFKAGDIVGYEGTNGKVGPLVVDYQRTDSNMVWLTKGTWITASSLFLWEEPQDADALPPAPESVLYVTNRSGPQRQLSIAACGGLIDMYASDGQGNGKSVVLGPDEVLQLCHDLRRMAMSIKKKEKQDN